MHRLCKVRADKCYCWAYFLRLGKAQVIKCILFHSTLRKHGYEGIDEVTLAWNWVPQLHKTINSLDIFKRKLSAKFAYRTTDAPFKAAIFVGAAKLAVQLVIAALLVKTKMLVRAAKLATHLVGAARLLLNQCVDDTRLGSMSSCCFDVLFVDA